MNILNKNKISMTNNLNNAQKQYLMIDSTHRKDTETDSAMVVQLSQPLLNCTSVKMTRITRPNMSYSEYK